ncbi:MAG: hypothetical protein AAGB14_03700 [Verrucomicrobiota bacterium]
MLRFPLVIALLFGAGCEVNHGDHPLHHPDLSLEAIARSDDHDNRVFTAYNPNGPVQWNQGWPWKFDLSGVSWDKTKTATAVTPRHVIMAAHFMRGVGEELVFHDRKGKIHRRTLIKRVTFKELGKRADIGVGLLDRPLPKTIRTYPLLEPKQDYRQLINGALALVTDQERRLYFHWINQAGETYLMLAYDDDLDPKRRKRLVVGDSGNPSFILTNGELALIGTFLVGGPGSGPFYGSRELQTTLSEIVRNLDPTYSLRTVAVDRKVLKESTDSGAHKPKKRDPNAKRTPPKTTPPPPAKPTRPPRPRTVRPPSE